MEFTTFGITNNINHKKNYIPSLISSKETFINDGSELSVLITVLFKDSMYVIKNDEQTVAFYNNVFDAISAASVEANGQGFTVNCNIPNSSSSKTFYTCPKCDFPVKVTGTLPTHDYEEFSKDLYAKCAYCNENFVIIWMRNRHLPE